MLVDCFPFLLCEYLVFYGISLHQGNMRSCKNHEQQFTFFWLFRPHKCKIVPFSFRYFVLVFYVNGRGSRWSFLERFPKAKRSKSKPRLLSSLLSLLKIYLHQKVCMAITLKRAVNFRSLSKLQSVVLSVGDKTQTLEISTTRSCTNLIQIKAWRDTNKGKNSGPH